MEDLLKTAKEFPQNPDLDQAFTVDSGLISELVRLAGLKESDEVMEIGAGLGFITKEILRAGCKVTAVEKDPRFVPGLEKIQNGNLKIISADFTKFTLPKFTKMISNVPFNSLEALVRILARSDFEKAVLITPLDFAKKLTAKTSGPLSFFARNFFDAEIAREVLPSSFYPESKVKSAVLVVSPP